MAVRSQAARVLAGLNPARWDDAMRTFGAIVPRRFHLANLPEKVHKIGRALEADNSSNLYLGLISYWQNPSDILNPEHQIDWTPPNARDWFDEEDPATSMMLADAQFYMHNDIMVKVDRASMAAGLEVRNPFLDSSVVEFARTLPLRFKIRNGVGKWIVRRVMDRYIPPELTMRPKMGFAIPLTSWLRGPLRDWAEDLIGDGSPHGEWLNRWAVQTVWHNFLSGDGGLTDKVWSLLMFQAWMKCEESCATISLHQSEFSANTPIFQ